MDARPPTSFEKDGAEKFVGAAGPSLRKLKTALASFPADEAGLRIHGNAQLRPFLQADGCIGAIAVKALGEKARPVRAILFNKTPQTNWSLAWHQDRTICVKDRREVTGFGPWTVKSGMHHVEPPIGLLAGMVTLRVHLDDVPAGNAPLLVALGSHRFGRVLEDEIDALVRQCGTTACLAAAGDIWLYATSILHASEAAKAPVNRRVLQVDFAAEELPDGLEWLGV